MVKGTEPCRAAAGKAIHVLGALGAWQQTGIPGQAQLYLGRDASQGCSNPGKGSGVRKEPTLAPRHH